MPTLFNKSRPTILSAILVVFLGPGTTAFGLDVPVPIIKTAPKPITHDAALWSAFLNQHVNDEGLVDYVAAKHDSNLLGFVSMLSEADPAVLSDPNARTAFWINAYNALAIYGVCQRLPNDRSGRDAFSVIDQHIEGLAPNKGFFVGLKFMVGGQRYSLDDIEKRILLRKLGGMSHGVRARYMSAAPKHGDPRIHFALVCCALGCPKLQREPYNAERLDAQLNEVAKVFFANPSQSRFDLKKKAWSVSELMQWYEADFVDAGFTNSEDSVLKFAANHVSDGSLAQALRSEPWSVSHIKYDWKLNIWRK